MIGAQSLLLPAKLGGFSFGPVPFLESIGPALRLLRQRRGVSQAKIERESGLGTSSLSRYERGTERPTLTTLDAILRGMDSSLRDLVLAIEEVEGQGVSALSGQPNARWVALLSERPLDAAWLSGLAVALLADGDEQAREDFVASVVSVAEARARRALVDVDAQARAVAEAAVSYDAPRPPGKGKR